MSSENPPPAASTFASAPLPARADRAQDLDEALLRDGLLHVGLVLCRILGRLFLLRLFFLFLLGACASSGALFLFLAASLLMGGFFGD